MRAATHPPRGTRKRRGRGRTSSDRTRGSTCGRCRCRRPVLAPPGPAVAARGKIPTSDGEREESVGPSGDASARTNTESLPECSPAAALGTPAQRRDETATGPALFGQVREAPRRCETPTHHEPAEPGCRDTVDKRDVGCLRRARWRRGESRVCLSRRLTSRVRSGNVIRFAGHFDGDFPTPARPALRVFLGGQAAAKITPGTAAGRYKKKTTQRRQVSGVGEHAPAAAFCVRARAQTHRRHHLSERARSSRARRLAARPCCVGRTNAPKPSQAHCLRKLPRPSQFLSSQGWRSAPARGGERTRYQYQ